MRRNWTTPVWALFAFASSILISTADSAPAGGLDLEERIRYQGLIERAYAEQRGASASDATKTLAIDAVPTEAKIRTKVETQLKMADALDRIWGQRLTQDDYQAEYERILAHSNDREMLGRLLGALDRDPDAVAACLIEPILVRRAVHNAFWWDAGIHAELLRTAEAELLTDNNAGGLDWFTGERTETEWRLAAGDEPPGMEYENGVQIRRLNQEQWNRLAEDLGHRWEIGTEPGDGLPLLQFSPLEETKEFLSASVILDRSATHLRLATHTWWKRTFSDWWEEHTSFFSIEQIDTDHSITLNRPHPAPLNEVETKDHVAVGDAWFSMNTSDPGTPSARDQHTVVWIGTQMIVWGGTNGSQVLSSGGVYDPSTDTWSATSQGANCPSPRVDHSMTWTRGEVFVWGGWDGSTNTNTGSRYDPSTNTWTAMAVDANTPIPRHDHAAIDNGWLYIWGGRGIAGLAPGGSYYDFTLDSWIADSPSANTPTARDQFLSIEDAADSDHFIWGGNDGTGYPSSGGRHNLTGSGWLSWNTSGAPSGRFGHSGVVTRSSPCGGTYPFTELIIWGGFGLSEPSPYYTNTGAINGISWTPTPTGAGVPSGRSKHTAVMTTDTDVMIVWGGTTSTGETATGGLMDYCDGSWSPTGESDPDLPSARTSHTAVWTGKTMLVWGGSTGGTALGDGGAYSFCWDAPTAAATPTVADEDPCAADGIRITWGSTPTWNDYDVHRSVTILRDSAVIASDLLPSNGSYLDTTAVEDQSYDYQVRFINSCGENITTASESGVDESSSAPTVTVAPTAVDADGCASSSGIDISWPADPDDWGDDGNGDRTYRVYRWRNEIEDWVLVSGQIDYGTTSYHDPSPNWGKYRVRYINGCGKQTYSPETELVFDLAGAAPTVDQSATAIDRNACNHNGNRITWPADPTAWGDGETGDRLYRVRRSTDGVNFNPIGDNLAYPSTSFVDATASADQEYHYQVRYKNGCDLSTDSGNDTSTDVDGETPVTGFNATASDPDTCDDGGVVITWPQDGDFWGDGESGTRTYEIVRGSTTIQTGITYGTTTYTDTSGPNGVAYTYRVRMVNGCGLSSLSGISSSVGDLPESPAITSTNNTAADIGDCTATGILITWPADPDGSWGDDGSGAHTYQIFRDGAVLQAGITYGTTEFTDSTATTGTEHTYTVRYLNCGGQYAETAGAAATDLDGAAPTVTANSPAVDTDNCLDDGITITWPADPDDWGDNDAGTRTYDVLRDGSPIQTGIAHGTTSFIDTTGDNGTAYLYQVRYANGCGLGASTTGDNGNDRPVAPAAPANNTAADIDACAATGVQVTWAADPDGPWGDGGGTHTYDVVRDGVALQTGISYGTTSFTDLTGTPGTPHTYSVRYVNCGNLQSETTGATAADIDGTPLTPAPPTVIDASACAQDGVWINWASSAGAATYDLRVDGVVEILGAQDPVLFDPGDSSPHTFEVRANGATCAGSWSGSSAITDLIDPNAQFCDGFRAGDTTAWSSATP